MGTLLRAMVLVGLLAVLSGSTQAALVGTNLGNLGVDPLLDGQYQQFGTFHAVKAGGSDIGGTADHGYFAYQELAGDGTITAQLFDFGSGINALRKGGLMIRDSLDPDANLIFDDINVSVFALFSTIGPDRRIEGQIRATTGGNTSIDASPAGNKGLTPWIRLTRTGNVFQAEYSSNTLVWTPFAQTWTVPMNGSVFVGLAATSHENPETTQITFRNLSITGFVAPSLLTWGEGGDGFWDVAANWDPDGTPDRTTHVALEGTNSDRVSIRAPAEALTLTVDGGDLVVQAGQKLQVFGGINVASGSLLELEAGATLDVYEGNIVEMAAWRGDSTVAVARDLTVGKLQGNGIFPGTLTKLGAGTLRLDNSPTGGVFADSTTFLVDAGTLASKGTDPLGNAPRVILDGATLALENAGLINSDTAVSVTASSLVNITSSGATLGPLSLNAVTLTTSGSGGVAFDGTSIAPGVAAVTLNTGMDMGSGPINLDVTPVMITKTGTAKLVVMGLGANMANATFNVQQGGLVAVHGSNPVAGAALTLNGGELILANNGPDNPALFDNKVTVTASSTLTGGKGGLPVGGAPSVRLGSTPTNSLTVNRGQTLTVRTTDGYTLDIAGALAVAGSGTATMTVTEGTVGLSGGGTLDRVNVNGPGTLNMTSPLAIPDVRAVGGVLNTSAVLTASTRLRATGGVTNIGAVLNATTLDVQGGVVNTTAVVNLTTLLASGGTLNMTAQANARDAILSGSALVNANKLVLTNSLLQGSTTYSVNTGTFTASGSNMLTGVNLSFGGNKLLVQDWGVAADSSGNGYDGTVRGATVSFDVPAVLAGGMSADMTRGDYSIVVDTDDPAGTDPDQNIFNLDTMTIAAWVKGWPDGSWEPFISKEGESGRGYQLRRYSGEADNLSFTLRGAGDDYQGADKNINDGQWHLIAATYDGANETIYIDGAVNATRAQTGTVNDTKSRLVFGGRDNSNGDPANIGNFPRVRMDDTRIYNRALSAAEITALFTNTGIPTNGLLGKWTFDDLGKALDLPNTSFTVTDDATLWANTAATVKLGNLALDPDVALTIQTQSTQPVSFGDLTAGDGSSIVGKLFIRDEVSVGSSPGVLDVIGDLTLAGTSVYAWDLTSTGSDLINVSKKLTLKDGWTLKIVTSEPLVYGEHLLFTYGTSVAPSIPNYDLRGAPNEWKWSANVLELEVDMDGNVFLLVPEPATWAMLLAAGVVGLLYARRRRRAA